MVVVVAKVGTAYYAMSNEKGTTAAPAAVAVTVSTEGTTSKISDPGEEIQWKITINNGKYQFGTGTNYLYCTNGNNGLRVGTNTDNVFSVEAASGYFVNDATSRYVGVYNNQDWRSYTSVNNNIKDQTFHIFVKQ